MIQIKEIENNNTKSEIAESVLRQLPDWFGIENSLCEYVQNVRGKTFLAAFDNSNIIGFISIATHNKFTAEIYVIGILGQYHRKGIGKLLLSAAEKILLDNNYKFLMVKTLGESKENESYEKTRNFYLGTGFYPLEEIKEIWGDDNPCLIMVKNLNTR